VIVTAAITGSIHTPGMSEYLPISPQEIANEALLAYEAGATVAHIHVRNPDTGQPVSDMDLFKEVIDKIENKCDMIICITSGGGLGMTVDERLKPVSLFKPEIASFNAGSTNFALFHILDKYKDFRFEWEKQYLEMTEDLIFPNTFKSMKKFAEVFNDNGTKPEFEVYDSGMINNISFMINKGYVTKPVYIQFVMGILGGISALPENLMFLLNYATKLIGQFEFSVCAAGHAQFPMCMQSLILGGNVRVGLEDNLYLEGGEKAKSNADQVTKIVRIAKELGIDPATPNEARQMLGLKGHANIKQ